VANWIRARSTVVDAIAITSRRYEAAHAGASSDGDEDPAGSIGETALMQLTRRRRHRRHNTAAKVAGAFWFARIVWRGLRA